MISPKQQKILAFPYSTYDALICDGAVRSGKTSIMMVSFVDWAMREFTGQRFGICGKTVDSATKNIIVPYISMSYAKGRYSLRWRRSEKLLEVRNGSRINYFEVFGGKDESSFMLIQGRTLAGVLLDEVALMPESFVNQALARCSVDGARMWFSCNPDTPNHWFYKTWIQKHAEKNALYLRFSMEDNPSLSKKTLERYRAMYSGVFYDRYILGLWVRAEGLIYGTFADDPSRWYVDEIPRVKEGRNKGRPDFRLVLAGVDFGGNRSAHAYTCTGITPDMSVYVLSSRKLPASGVSVEGLIKDFTAWGAAVEQEYGVDIDGVYADSAEQTIINSMHQNTQYKIYNSVKGEILDRIRCTDILMTTGRLRILRGRCDSLVEALCTAVWDMDKWDDVRLDDGTTDIDTLDSFEYSWSAYIPQLLRG